MIRVLERVEVFVDELDVDEEKIRQIIAIAEQESRVATAEFERVGALFERALAAENELNGATIAQQRARRPVEGYRRAAAMIDPQRPRRDSTTVETMARAICRVRSVLRPSTTITSHALPPRMRSGVWAIVLSSLNVGIMTDSRRSPGGPSVGL